MKVQAYTRFSLRAHQKNFKHALPNSAEFELTFGCGMHCRHCYTDCYNKPELVKRELTTGQVRMILRKLRSAGILWLCLTGGDPVWRADFCQIYGYAKKLGFLISVYTSGYSLTPEVLRLWKDKPPFVVEVTLNAVSKSLHEKIARVPAGFSRVMKAIASLKKNGIALKIKTMVTRDNRRQVGRIRKFVRAQGLRFSADYDVYPRLDRDLFPLSLRLSWQERLCIAGVRSLKTACLPKQRRVAVADVSSSARGPAPLFMCNAQHSDTLIVDPYGHAFLCSLLRFPSFDLLKESCLSGYRKVLRTMQSMDFTSATPCSSCARRQVCLNCPGNAFLETGDPQQPSEYYCRLAHSGAHQTDI